MSVRLVQVNKLLICQISLLILIGFLTVTICSGQNRSPRGLVSFGASSGLADDTLYLDINQDIAVQLLPFEDLMKVAVAHSPLVKYQSEVANSLNEGYEIAKVQILQNVAGAANYSTGNQVLISSGGIQGGTAAGSTIGQIANGYRVGIDVRLPLYELFGRKHQVRQAQANYKAAVLQKEVVELQLKRDLIGIYQDMITTQQLLKILLIDEQASLTAMRVGRLKFRKVR
ncbi:TolC family protein [Spirosoma telluris]|uniref:TolC family protein n=1 Tax=Spirosoma telluris TaxID=2183553 RepID=UPI002FC2CBE2